MIEHMAVAARSTISRMQGVIKEAVHVKIHPRPRNLAESREVLRILQRYGEVAVYRHLKVGIWPRDHDKTSFDFGELAEMMLIYIYPIDFNSTRLLLQPLTP